MHHPDFICPLWLTENPILFHKFIPYYIKNSDISRHVRNSNLVGGLEHFLFFHILGMSSSQLTKSIIFQRGRSPTRLSWRIIFPISGTCYSTWYSHDIPYIGNNHPNWLIFFRGVEATNQDSIPHDFPHDIHQIQKIHIFFLGLAVPQVSQEQASMVFDDFGKLGMQKINFLKAVAWHTYIIYIYIIIYIIYIIYNIYNNYNI